MSARPCSSWKSRGARPALPFRFRLRQVEISFEPDVFWNGGVDQGIEIFEADLAQHDARLLLRSDQYGGARRNLDRLFLHAVAWEQTTESESRFKFVGALRRSRPTIY